MKNATTMALAVLLALGLSTAQLRAQKGNDLEPSLGLYGGFAEADPYDEVLRDVLLGEHGYRFCQMLVKPSFEREWAVYVVDAEHRRASGYARPTAPIIVYKIFARALYDQFVEIDAKDPDEERRLLAKADLTLHRFEVPIARETAALLIETWSRMLARTRYVDSNSITVTGDGVRYYFAQWEPGSFRTGDTWSPEPGTRTGQLVAIGERLRDYMLASPEERRKIEREVHARAEALLAQIRKLEAPAVPDGVRPPD